MVTQFAMDLFNDPFFIGFGRDVQRIIDNKEIFSTNYPPHNLIKINEDAYRIELAVAGFKKEELEIDVHMNELTVYGNQEDQKDSSFIHKGIAARNFRKVFALGEYMEVTSASLDNGMLTINIDRNIPEEKKPKTIKIK